MCCWLWFDFTSLWLFLTSPHNFKNQEYTPAARASSSSGVAVRIQWSCISFANFTIWIMRCTHTGCRKSSVHWVTCSIAKRPASLLTKRSDRMMLPRGPVAKMLTSRSGTIRKTSILVSWGSKSESTRLHDITWQVPLPPCVCIWKSPKTILFEVPMSWV